MKSNGKLPMHTETYNITPAHKRMMNVVSSNLLRAKHRSIYGNVKKDTTDALTTPAANHDTCPMGICNSSVTNSGIAETGA